MSASGEQTNSPEPVVSPEREANVSALLWLARWIGLPLLAVIGIYYAEPLFRGGPVAEFVPSNSVQEVHPYPYDSNSGGPSLAPIEVPRLPPLPYPAFPDDAAPPPATPAEIVAKPIFQPQPVYPPRALEREKEGMVRVRIHIAADGSVSEATVVQASPAGWFEAAALDAVKRWRYQPPGRPLVTETVIEFKLD